MKRSCCLVVFLFLAVLCNSQTIHKATGISDYSEVFYDSKIDPNDGGTVSVGTRKFGTSSQGDVLIVKLDAARNILWQKTILTNGDGAFYKVKVCANGDYLVAGKSVYNNSSPKAILCRINSLTGDLIWSCVPNTSQITLDAFWDMIETSSGTIAIVGGLSNLKKVYVALVSSGGVYSTSISSALSGNEFRSIAELPNGNLIVAGYMNSGSSYYYAIMVELNPTTLATVAQTRYAINLAIPGGSTVKSLWPISLSVKNNNVLLSCIAFPALISTAAAGICVYNYNLTTRALTGNLYYQPGYTNATGYSFFPLTETDFLLSQTYTSPSLHISASRITGGTRVFDRKINGAVSNIASLYAYNGDLVCAGKVDRTLPAANTDGYNLFSSVDLPVASSLCDVTDINTLASLASNITATSTSFAISPGEPTMKITPVTQNTVCTIEDPCVPAATSFTFTGNGLWTVVANWENNVKPSAILPAGSTITINPAVGGSCILNVQQTISNGAHLVITAGANFVVQAGIYINATEVAICNQVWDMKNLNVSTYRNGDPVPKVTDPVAWGALTTGAYCYFNNDSATYAAVYGKLYNWYAVTDPRGLAPVGWHIPTHTEFGPLSTCMGGYFFAGGPLKETGLAHWNNPNTGATDSIGFTAVPGGRRLETGVFDDLGFTCIFWCTTVASSTEAWGRVIFNYDVPFYSTSNVFARGLSVRCVRD